MMEEAMGQSTLTEQDNDLSPEQRALETLEEEIAFGQLHPRERLIEDELMRRFDLTRHAVRSVLAELDRMGLVERHKHQGAFVVFHSLKEVKDLYQVRELLETCAAGLINFPVAPQRLEGLIAIQKEYDAANEANDLRRLFRANIKFHKALFELCDNQVLLRAIQEHALQAHPIRSRMQTLSVYRTQMRDEHWQMIEALKNSDAGRLIEICRNHLRPSRDAYIETQGMFEHVSEPVSSGNPNHE